MVSNTNIALVFAVLSLAFLSGCLITRNEAECADLQARATDASSPSHLLRVGDAAMCYHEVAVGYAIRNLSNEAVNACDHVGTAAMAMANSEQNNCYADIAEILHNRTICEKIVTGFNEEPQTVIGGESWAFFRNNCFTKAEPPPSKMPDCSTIIQFALIPIAVLFISRHNRK